jgi:predicted GIY-YIG superfamily endonuclease
MTCCVYVIQNQVNGHCYIGSTLNFEKRINTHFRDLRKKIKDHYGNIYSSITDASKKTFISISSICDNLKGRSKITRKGYLFSYLNENEVINGNS